MHPGCNLMAMTLALQRFRGSDEVVLGRLGPLFLNMWFKVPTVQALETLRVAQQQVKDPHVVLTVLQDIPRGSMPDDAKDLAARIYDEGLDRVRAHANVVEVKGFFGAAVRAVMNSGNLIKPGAYPTKIYSTVDEAAPWLATMTTPLHASCSAAAIAGAVAELRAR